MSDHKGEDPLRKALQLVHKYTGITMSDSKQALLKGRLSRRVNELSCKDIGEYADYLESHGDEVQTFINLVTTNETSFFRTTRVWDFLRDEFLPQWAAKSAGRPLQVWSAAASTGEEAYSIAMTCEEFKLKKPGLVYSILGTDIDTEVLAIAERAEYGGRSAAGLSSRHPSLMAKYSKTSENGIVIADDVRRHVRFASHDLFRAPPKRNFFDLIFLRNVLIYFSGPDQEKVLANIYSALAPGGILIIGESESLSRLATKFEFRAPLIYARTGS